MYKYYQKDNLDLYLAKTLHQDIVTIVGMADIKNHENYNALELELFAYLLDKATTNNSKLELANIIESMGANLNFDVSHDKLYWTASCLSKDVQRLYDMINEMLASSLFLEEEAFLWLKLTISAAKEDLSDISSQASIAFNRLIYPLHHPLRKNLTTEDILWLEQVDIKSLCLKIRGMDIFNIKIIAVGDVDDKYHQSCLESWQYSKLKIDIAKSWSLPESVSTRDHIEIADKISLDVRLGQALNIDVHHHDYWPLIVGIDALGGTFSARLMQTVRDQEGLTYGVNSSLQGGMPKYGACFAIGITLSPANLEKGIASVQRQINKWWQDGLGENELMARKRGLLGRHVVRSTKTTQIAMLIRHEILYGFENNYSNLYVKFIDQVTLDQVNQALREWINPDQMLIVSSGSSK